jgi:hypothetical protein
MKEKLFKLTLCTFIFIFLFVIIVTTYAKYITSQASKAQARVAQWNINLNDLDISECADFSDLIELTYVNNPHIANDVIVPTSSGYFIVNLDSTGTELPFTYEFSLDVSESAVADYRITSYLLYDGASYHNPLTPAELADLQSQTDDFVELSSSSTTITGEVNPPTDLDRPVVNSFLIYFGWYDGPNEVLDNRNDVAVSKTALSSTPVEKGVITLNLSVTQKEDT